MTSAFDCHPAFAPISELQGAVKNTGWVTSHAEDKTFCLGELYKVGGLIASRSRERDTLGSTSGSRVTLPKGNYTHGTCPLASFPNDHFRLVGAPKWVAPAPSNPVAELRKLARVTNWEKMYEDGKTLTLVDPDFCGTEERCELLKTLVEDSNATNVLEVGSFIGISTLSMAEKLPDSGRITSLEIDPFIASFGEAVRAKAQASKKINYMIGSATESLERLAAQFAAVPSNLKPFDFVVIDADQANTSAYFNFVCKAPGLLAKAATVCVDMSPCKGQAPVRCMGTNASGATQWIVPSGQPEVNAFRAALDESKLSYQKLGNMLVVQAIGESR